MQLGTYTIDGGPLVYDESLGTFEVGGKTVTADRVRELDHLEKIVWASDDSRIWFYATFPGDVPKAATATDPKAKPKVTGCGVLLLLLIVVGLVAFGVSMCGGSGSDSSTPDPALASQAQQALAAGGASALGVSQVDATGDGYVIITLRFTKEALGGIEGDNKARQISSGIANTVLNGVPAAMTVGVFDANNKMIDVYKRQ
jgi:hypothetical protein